MFGEDKELTRLTEQLEESVKKMVLFYSSLSELFCDLVDLENTDIDNLFDKYEVTIKGKYPRGKDWVK